MGRFLHVLFYFYSSDFYKQRMALMLVNDSFLELVFLPLTEAGKKQEIPYLLTCFDRQG